MKKFPMVPLAGRRLRLRRREFCRGAIYAHRSPQVRLEFALCAVQRAKFSSRATVSSRGAGRDLSVEFGLTIEVRSQSLWER